MGDDKRKVFSLSHYIFIKLEPGENGEKESAELSWVELRAKPFHLIGNGTNTLDPARKWILYLRAK